MKTKIIYGCIIVMLLVFVGIQLVAVERDNPPVIAAVPWDSPQTKRLAERACYDCHSNETKWPWYAFVAPVSWLIAHDVKEGREHLNFSEWAPGMGRDAAVEVEEGDMPLWYYLSAHPEARLTDEEKQKFIAGLKATFGFEEEY